MVSVSFFLCKVVFLICLCKAVSVSNYLLGEFHHLKTYAANSLGIFPVSGNKESCLGPVF